MAEKQKNTYHSSGSLNTAEKQKGDYKATRNGVKPAYNPQSNNAKKSAKSNGKQAGFRQSNVSRVQNEDHDEPELAKLGAEQQIKKAAAKKTLTEAAKAYNPAVGLAVEKALETPKGDEYLDTFAKQSSTSEGVKAVVEKAHNESKKKRRIITALVAFGPFLFFLILVGAVLGKNADTQEISHDVNYWQEEKSEETGYFDDPETGLYNKYYDDSDSNVFLNYKGMYEEVSKAVRDVSQEDQIVVDKYLILATLIAPIENGLIKPVEREDCEGKKPQLNANMCYPVKNEDGVTKYYYYDEFIKVWSSQAKLLAKMQIMTYSAGSAKSGDKNSDNEAKNVECGNQLTGDEKISMEKVASTDENLNKFTFWNIFLPWKWGENYNDIISREVNVFCTGAPPSPDYPVPDVKVLSIDQATFYYLPDGENYMKDETTGGVYYWNLVNKNGFIDSYFKDYLAYDETKDEDTNYNKNLPKIVEIANYIYSYYDSIRLDCDDYKVIEQKIDKVRFREDINSAIYTLDFEEVFVGGSVLATFGSATGEVAKAQAVITRSEAYAYVNGNINNIIVGTAKMGCWWWKYNPTYNPTYEDQKDNPNYDPDYPKNHFPDIYNAIQETKGLVVTNWGSYKVLETEYDAFCPQTREPEDGFYNLPDGQRDLPIQMSTPSNWARCPCFKNNDNMPKTHFFREDPQGNVHIENEMFSEPEQNTLTECWEETGNRREVASGFTNYYERELKYSATGGHGRGVSQHGMAYFSGFHYKWDALLALFLDHNSSVKSNANITFRRLSDTIPMGQCPYAKVFDKSENK